MRVQKFTCGIGVLFFLIGLVWGTSAFAGALSMTATAVITTSTTETVTTDLDFGSIDLDPAGDTITIDASGGSATPAAGAASVVTGGTSGLITIVSQVVMHVDVTYPAADVTLTSGANTLTLTSANIIANSQYDDGGAGADTLGGGTPLSINVGGVIVIPAGQANGTYTGTINVTVNYS